MYWHLIFINCNAIVHKRADVQYRVIKYGIHKYLTHTYTRT